MLGKSLAHYSIVDVLGQGGMGEVYRATDSRLDRQVALKLLPSELSRDPERLARLQREAKTLASLQHPNVATVYDFGTEGDTSYLTMELVEGEDLTHRLQRGPIPVEEAVQLGLQVARGLEAAHAGNVVHRDLKPGNIRITADGRIKILDFGLARVDAAPQSDQSLANSPTITGAFTQAGTILGTAAYMSPEQARGQAVDARADIWSFGVVLFEMLTGRPVFEGATASDTLAGVLRADLPWDQLPGRTPAPLKLLLERCLDRDPSRRLQSIAEARIVLQDLKAGRATIVQAPVATESRTGFGRERIAWIVAVVALLGALGAAAFLREPPPEPRLVRSSLMPPENWDFAPASPFAVSPDGTRIAYVAVARPEAGEVAGSNRIWIRDLASAEPRALAEAEGDAYPFWSPDGRWVGFFTGGKLNKIEARGGPVVPLCDATDGRGGTWGKDGTIVFQKVWSGPLMRVSAAGGTPEPVTTLNKDRAEMAHRWPSFLPDGRHFLYYVVSTTNPTASPEAGIYIASLDNGESRMLLRSDSRGLVSRGHLLYRAGSTLMARPFDPGSRQFTGEPVPLATDIPGGTISWGGAQFGASDTGVIVHMQGAGATSTLLNWRDRSGELLDTVAGPAGFWEPRLSRDGTRLAVAVGEDVGDIWIYDLETEAKTRFTLHTSDDRTPLWSPDDDRIVFQSSRTADGEIYMRPTSGQGDPQLIYTAGAQVILDDWSRDGRLVLFSQLDPENDYDIWTLDMTTYEAQPLLTGPTSQLSARLSPDGKWLAFSSNESGTYEIYVQSFPEAAGRWVVSGDGQKSPAGLPLWRGDGRELFYLRAGAIVSVPVTGTAGFSFGEPTVLLRMSATSSNADYLVSHDGQRILTNELPPADPNKIGARLIQNWTAALER